MNRGWRAGAAPPDRSLVTKLELRAKQSTGSGMCAEKGGRARSRPRRRAKRSAQCCHAPVVAALAVREHVAAAATDVSARGGVRCGGVRSRARRRAVWPLIRMRLR
eukprot:2290907-Pleurochrysis_carterae.AAC.1